MRHLIEDTSKRPATILAAAFFAISIALLPAVAAETPKAKPTGQSADAKDAETEAEKPKPISFADYVAGLSKPGMSDGDKEAFAKKHAGASVSWTGYVRNLSKNVSETTTLTLILKEKPTDEVPIAVFLAEFDAAHEKELLALDKDQKAVVSGTLTVGRNPGLPSLADAELKK